MVEEQITIFDASPESQNHDYRLTADELQKELSKFNLTANQSKVYIFLGKYGSKTAPEVCKALKIARTETYHLLSTLQSKGIVSATFEHPIKFSAVPVNKAMTTLVNSEKERVKELEKQEEQISKLWQSIPDFIQTSEKSKEDRFQMLQGANPINSKLSDIIESSKEEILILGSEKDHLKLYHSDLFAKINQTKCQSKILTSCSEKTKYVFEDMKKADIKKLPKTFEESICFIIKDGSEMVFYTKNNILPSQQTMAMWTNSVPLIYSMKLLFLSLWSSSKTQM